jgi:phosphoenolpyruvate carboxylase
VHRIRRRRDYQKAGAAPQPGGLGAVMQELQSSGVSLADLLPVLQRLHVEPVFTAHPTEVVRRALLNKERDVVRLLIEDIDRALTPDERRKNRERIRVSLTSAWQTSEMPPSKPTVRDETEHVGFYLSEVLYRVLPTFQEALEEAVTRPMGPVRRCRTCSASRPGSAATWTAIRMSAPPPSSMRWRRSAGSC